MWQSLHRSGFAAKIFGWVVFLGFMFSAEGSVGYVEPWGKDSALLIKEEKPALPPHSSPAIWAAEKIIWFHQNVLSPVDGPRSHFRPSSSQYMLEAMRRHGFFEGFCLGCDRLLRENSDAWVYRTVEYSGKTYKWNPVP